jgi:hypothetical protein
MDKNKKHSNGFWSFRRLKDGQGLVEFALILPVILVSLFVIIELARVLHAWMALENGARTGIRYAVTGEFDPSNCNGGFLGENCTLPSDEPEARVESIHEASWAGSSSIIRVQEFEVTNNEPKYFKVTVCDPDNMLTPSTTFGIHQCLGGVEDPGDPGDIVSIVLEFNHPLILPGLSSVWPQLRLTARSDATVETFRITSSSGNPPTVVAPPPPVTNTPPASITPVPTEPQPDCSKINFTYWKWYPTRFYVLLRDSNLQDGYISKITVSWPDDDDYYVDYIDFNPDSTNTEWEFDITNGNHSDSAWSKSFSTPNNYRVSPPGVVKSRISVGFSGDLPGDQLENGNYTVQLEVQYPGYLDDSGGTKTCYPSISKNRNSTVATSTARSGDDDDDDEPTPEFPPTNTPPGPSTPVPPTDPPPTARD